MNEMTLLCRITAVKLCETAQGSVFVIIIIFFNWSRFSQVGCDSLLWPLEVSMTTHIKGRGVCLHGQTANTHL